jgi:hypothetical protein
MECSVVRAVGFKSNRSISIDFSDFTQTPTPNCRDQCQNVRILRLYSREHSGIRVLLRDSDNSPRRRPHHHAQRVPLTLSLRTMHGMGSQSLYQTLRRVR